MRENSPAVTVIIPCFNDGAFLSEALESLFAQTSFDWEAVVVDDGSTDPQTLNVLNSINHSKVLVHRHEKNRGLAAARNSGIRLTTAPIIFPLDADDQFVPESVDIVIQAFNKHPSIDVFYPDVIHFGEENRIRINPEFDIPTYLRQPFLQAQSPFRRSAYAKSGGYCEHEVLRLGMEDADFWLSLIETGARFQRLPYSIYKYRIHRGSLSERMQDNNYKIRSFIANRHRKALFGSYRREYLHLGAIRSYRFAISRRHWKKVFMSALHVYQHCLWPPRLWWRATWNIVDALVHRKCIS